MEKETQINRDNYEPFISICSHSNNNDCLWSIQIGRDPRNYIYGLDDTFRDSRYKTI